MKIRSRYLGFCPSSVRRPGPRLGFRGIAGLLAVAMLVGLAHPVMAAGNEGEQTQAQLRRAAAAFDLGYYAEAAKAYEAAYLTSWDPSVLVQVGQTWQLAGDRQKALTAFRSYVRVAPNGEQRALCETRIRELEGQPGQTMAAPMPGAIGPPMMAAPPPSAPPPLPAPMVVMPPPTLPPPAYPMPAAPAPATTFAVGDARATAAESPVYHRWPFWIVVGTVIVGGTALAVWYTRDRDLAMPATTFGARQF